MKKDVELYRQEIYKVLRKKFDNDFINEKELNEIVLELESIYNQSETTLAQDQKLLTEAQFISKTGHYIFDIPNGVWTSSEGLNSIFEIDESFEKSIESWLGLVHPDFKTEMQEYVFKHILTDHNQFDKQYKIKTPTRKEKWVHGRGNLTLDSENNPTKVFGVIQDITDQKRNEDLLNESNIRYSLAVNSAGLGVWEWDLTRDELTWDNRMYDIYELRKEDFAAALDAWLKCIHPDDSDRLADEINLAIENKKPYDTEFKIISGKGEVKYIKAYGTITRDLNGKALKMYGVNLDITDRKVAEELLIQSEKRYHNFFNYDLTGDYLSTPEGKILDFNDAFAEMLGFTDRDELLHFDPNLLYLHKKDRTDFLELLRKEKIITHHKIDVRRKDGEIIHCIENCIGLFDENDNLIKIQGYLFDISEIERATAALKESEKKFRLLFKNMVEGFALHEIITDENNNPVDYVIIDANPAYERITGLKRSAIIGKPITEVLPGTKSEPANWIERYGKVALTGEYTSFEEYSIAFGRWYLITAYSPQLRQFAVIIEDITEAKLAEEKIKESEEEKSKILSATLSGLYIYNNQIRKYEYINPAHTNITGWSLQELNGMGEEFFDLIHPEDLEKVVEHFKILIKNKEDLTQIIEYRFKTKEGAWIWLISYDRPYERDKNGNVVKFIGSFIDNTKQKEVEFALRESESRFRLIFDNTKNIAVQGYQKDGTVHYWNKASEDLYGYTKEEAFGKSLYELIIPDNYIPNVKAAVKQMFESDKPIPPEEIQLKKKDGSLVPVYSNHTVVNVVGNQKELYCIDIDLTERKKAQKAVVETQRLGAIGEMSSAIAHDFNNSLQSILGNLELALYNIADDHPSNKYLEVIQTATSDAATRVRQLQRFAGKSNKHDEFSTIDINEIVKDVILQSRPLWKDSPEKEGIKFNLKTDLGELPQTSGNEGELRSVLYNIVKNCVESMLKGGIVTIKTYFENEYINILIKDEGVGMDDETKSRIFQPFFTTKGFETGRGLGMSAAYSIIKEHDGNIYVKESIPNSGTTIAIEIPSSKNIIKPISKTHLNDKPLSTANILWVDDDKSIREIAEEMLVVIGHSGKVVGSGSEALKELENNKFDLVVTDIGMPEMSGWDLADKIFKMFNGKMKVAVLTGWGDQISEEKRKQHNVKYVIGKPFRINELDLLINKILQSE